MYWVESIVNRVYKTVWNERTRTFVAVSELAHARGKSARTSVGSVSSRARLSGLLSLAAAVLAGAILSSMGAPAFADVSIDDSVSPVHADGNSIQFSNGAGVVDFQDGGTISGLTASTLVSNGTNAVTTGQLWQTNEDLVTVTATVTGLNASVGALTTDVGSLTTNVGALNTSVGALTSNIGALSTTVDTHATQISSLQTAANASVRYDDAAAKNLITLQGGGSGTRITNLADGNIASGSKDAITGGQMYTLEQKLYSQGQGVKYFHANSALDDSTAAGSESIAIGPEAESAGKGSFAAGHGAATTASAEAAQPTPGLAQCAAVR